MTIYSVCIIDDKLPAHRYSEVIDDTNILNENNFKHLLSNREIWDEVELFELSEKIFADASYSVSGFTSHKFFINYVSDHIFSPDVIVFDWDVGEATSDSEKNLLRILEMQYCLVAIYTGADKKDEVTRIIESDKFSEYKDSRLFLLDKGDENSVVTLTAEITNKLKYFSFKLGKTLKYNTVLAVNNILNHIGRLSFEQFISLFGSKGTDGKKVITENEFVDLFLNKLKYELNNLPLNVALEAQNNPVEDLELIRKLWEFRLYHNTSDEIIRMGDILQKDDDEDKLYLVLSSDCHLDEFLNKTLGHLAVVNLHKVVAENESFKERLNYRTNGSIANHTVSSLVNPKGIDFLTILPSICLDETKCFDYALSARECHTLELKLKDNAHENLLVSDIEGYKRIISVSEPFISSLRQFVIQNFSGFGLPDFSKELKDDMRSNLQKLKQQS